MTQKNTEKLKTVTLKELAKEWGLDYQVLKIKQELIASIKKVCEKENISQRKLASMVDGLTQDRVSKIFSGQIGHMSIDKMVEILSALNLRLELRTKSNTKR